MAWFLSVMKFLITLWSNSRLLFPLLPFLTDTGHAGDVQAVAIETVAGKAFRNAHTAAMGTAVQDSALLSLQAFIGLNQGSCREHKEL